ncbi:esterase/lipase family protein [Nocardia sp. NPDC006044]|uniref:esterase/lipase family protein n=1 Tax=Nocardia sp. NPDC006044 TaxID=3364306 RepID=UPI003678E7D5
MTAAVRRIPFAATLSVLLAGFAVSATAAPVFSAGGAPSGVNDVSCRPTAAHPNPVVLVHGSGTNLQNTFVALGPAIHNAGYCVFAANIGRAPTLIDAMREGSAAPSLGAALAGHQVYGVLDIDVMAIELAQVVENVRKTTGAVQVALVGHSIGGTVIREYLRATGASSAAAVVTLGTPYRGSTWAGLRAEYPDFAAAGMSNA